MARVLTGKGILWAHGRFTMLADVRGLIAWVQEKHISDIERS